MNMVYLISIIHAQFVVLRVDMQEIFLDKHSLSIHLVLLHSIFGYNIVEQRFWDTGLCTSPMVPNLQPHCDNKTLR